MSELLSMEASKSMIGMKAAWAIQEEAFQSNLPLNNNQVKLTIEVSKELFEEAIKAVYPEVSKEWQQKQ